MRAKPGSGRPGAAPPGAMPAEAPPGALPPGAPGAMRPGAPGETPAGQAAPGAFPGFNGQPGMNNGSSSPFGAAVAAGSPEFAVQQFLEKLNGDDMTDVSSLFSRKSIGLAKTIREGKISADKLSELKSGVAGSKANPAMVMQGKRVIVLEHADNNQSGGGFAAPTQSSGRSGRDQTNKPKPTLKVQFTVVQEEGQMLIQDIRISNTTAQIRQRTQRNR
ncbi:MAG TPA: hypothetical protein VHB99_15540 [Pirellulales bacterium]|nr:hypothetical protein [Pirellulales bacterium]